MSFDYFAWLIAGVAAILGLFSFGAKKFLENYIKIKFEDLKKDLDRENEAYKHAGKIFIESQIKINDELTSLTHKARNRVRKKGHVFILDKSEE